MQNASLVRPPESLDPSAIVSQVGLSCPPHIFEPNQANEQRDISRLFNLRRRPGYYNAAEKVALLRRAKQPPHDELFVDFAGPQSKVALAAGGIPLVIGDWSWNATANNEPLASRGPWSEVCWQSKKAYDYLEIEMPLSSEWKLRRQMLLAREDRFLLLADALLGPDAEAVELRYSSSLPMTQGVSFCGARETREAGLDVGGRRRATIIPPALAEWRCEFCHAELHGGDNGLTLQQAALGRNLYAPIWIDLDSGRLQRPLTWRRLTVAENFATVPRDTAAAFRIQAGRDQWLIYRSLGPTGNRSVLGYNTQRSFACLRIEAGGATKKIIEIE